MWLLQGRFGEEERTQQSKLLKYGTTYVLGRKIPADIIVESKFVSRTVCRISVGDLTSEQRSHIDARPECTITFEPSKSRPTFTIRRPDRDDPDTLHETSVPAQQQAILDDGSSFILTTTITLTLVWRPFAVCFSGRVKQPTIDPWIEAARSLGIYLSPAKSRWRDGYTHLCLSQIKPTETTLSALVQARPIVTPSFVEELLRLGQLPRHGDETSLETHFREPDYAEHTPEVNASDFVDVIDVQHLTLPSEVRPQMFSGTTCVFFVLPEDENEFAVYRSVLTLGGAQVISHNPVDEGLRIKADFVRLLMSYRNRAITYRRNSNPVGIREAPDDGLVVLCNQGLELRPWRQACAAACINLQIPMPSGFHAVSEAVTCAGVRSRLNVLPTAEDVDGEGDDGEDGDTGGPAAIEARPEQPQPAPIAASDANVTHVEPSANDEVAAAAMDVDQGPAQPAAPDGAGAVSTTSIEPSGPTAAPMAGAAATEMTTSIRRPLRRRAQRINILDEIYGGSGGGEGEDQLVAAVPDADVPELGQDGDAGNDAPAAVATPGLAGSAALPAEPAPSVIPPTPLRRTGSRLTRRTGTDSTKSRRSELFDNLLQGAVSGPFDAGSGAGGAGSSSLSLGAMPKSKKYRMELDEEDRRESQLLDDVQGQATSQQQQQGESVRGEAAAAVGDGSRLGTVLEDGTVVIETRDSAAGPRTAGRDGRKRRAPSQDVEMADEDAASGGRKRHRTVSVVDEGDESDAAARRSTAHNKDAGEEGRMIHRAANDKDGVGGGLERGGQPDSEPEFLLVLNTQKSRRKKMDEFDDEFNQLKITKPSLTAARAGKRGQASTVAGGDATSGYKGQEDKFYVDEDFEAFKKLAEEELRIDVRGNFVQVDFVPLVVKRSHGHNVASPSPASNPEWQGVPNFKKFKPKARTQHQQQQEEGSTGSGSATMTMTMTAPPATSRRQPVAMQLTEANDYGIGDSYWKKGSTNTQAAAAVPNRIEVDGQEEDLIAPPPHGGRVCGTNINLVLSDDSDADAGPRGGRRGKAAAAAVPSTARASAKTTTRGRTATAESATMEEDVSDSQPVRANLDLTGLDSDEEDLSILQPVRVPASTATRTRRGATQAAGSQPSSTVRGTSGESSETIRGAKRPHPAPLDEEEDEDSQPPLRSTSPRKKGKTTKEVVVLSSDDNGEDADDGDGDGNFAGFGASTSARNGRGVAKAGTGGTASTQRRPRSRF